MKDVSKTYDSVAGKIVALSNINFAIKKREFMSIVGPSGSGDVNVALGIYLSIYAIY